MAAPSYVQHVKSQTTTQVSSYTPSPYLTGIVSGNLLIMIAITNGRTVATPTGWSLLVNGSTHPYANSGDYLYIFYKIAGGSESAPTLTAAGGTTYWLVSTTEINGANAASPFDTAGVQFATPVTGASVVAPAITTTANDALVVHLAATAWSGSEFSTTGPSGTTQRYRDGNTTSGQENVWADETQATAGAVPTRTFNRSGGGGGTSLPITFAISSVPISSIAAPFIASVTSVYTPTLVPEIPNPIAAPFIAASTSVFTPILSPIGFNPIVAPFIPSSTSVYTPTVHSTAGGGGGGVVLGPHELWTVKHREHDGTLIETVFPENLNFTLNKKPPHTIQYEISLSSPLVSHDFVGPYRTDFELLYKDYVIMRGHHTFLDVGLGDEHVTVYGKDWWHYLERRHFPFNPKPNNVNDYVIGTPSVGLAYEALDYVNVHITELLDVTLARPNSLNITYPTLGTAIGSPVGYSLPLGDTTSLASIIEGLSDIEPGFQYEIRPDKELRLYTPQKYDVSVWNTPANGQHIFTIDDPSIIELRFSNAGPDGTHWLGIAGGIGQNKVGAARGLVANEAIYRRLDGSSEYGDNMNLSNVIARTMGDLKHGANPQHEITFKVDPSKIEDFWILFEPGYAIWINIDLIAHQIDSAQEITRMDCTVDNEGNAEVDFGLDQIYENTNAGVLRA
jgi:hypothetical protein